MASRDSLRSQLVVRRSMGADGLDARALLAASRAALAWDGLAGPELWLAQPRDEAIALGAFQRTSGLDLAPRDEAATIARRGSGGPAVRVGEGTLWAAVLLPRADALVACDAARLVNRHVRPLLRALTKAGHLAHYFGRDWVSVRHRPAAWIGFAHDAASGRAVVEAFVACGTRFDVGARASFAGKQPVVLNGDPATIADGVVAAWCAASDREARVAGAIPSFDEGDAPDPRADPPWAAVVDEAIGPIGAGPDARGVFRVGGDWLVSGDAVRALEARLADATAGDATDGDVGAIVDATLAAPGVALDGVRSLGSVRDAIVAARTALGARRSPT